MNLVTSIQDFSYCSFIFQVRLHPCYKGGYRLSLLEPGFKLHVHVASRTPNFIETMLKHPSVGESVHHYIFCQKINKYIYFA